MGESRLAHTGQKRTVATGAFCQRTTVRRLSNCCSCIGSGDKRCKGTEVRLNGGNDIGSSISSRKTNHELDEFPCL